MHLRIIITVLCTLAFLSSAINVYFYYMALKDSVRSEALKEAELRLLGVSRDISAFVVEQNKPVKILAGLKEIKQFVQNPNDVDLHKVNLILDHFDESMEGSICFVMDLNGSILASSNRAGSDHLVGNNFSHIPYFVESLKGKPAIYLGLVTETGKRAVFNSFPIMNDRGDSIIGVAAIRTSVDYFRRQLVQTDEETVMAVSPSGIIFVSSDPKWRFKTLDKLSPEQSLNIVNSRQFGSGPFEWSGLTKKDGNLWIDQSGIQYLEYSISLVSLPGWRLIYLRDMNTIYEQVVNPIFSLTTYPVIPLGLFVLVSVMILYKKASQDILQLHVAESRLRESEERFRELYDRTPGMLLAIDPDSKIIDVNNQLLKTLGYGREEVVGRKLTDFFTEDSGHRFNEMAASEFRTMENISEFPFQLKRKGGATVDILFSAVADRDGLGIVFRFICVLIDVTGHKQCEEELKALRKQLHIGVS